LLLYGEKRLGPKLHLASAFLVFLGSWLSGYFIIATDAWMQHPVAYRIAENGQIQIESLARMLTNPWIFWQYLHNMIATIVTGSFVMAGIGAYYVLTNKHTEHGKTFLRVGVVAGFLAISLTMFPAGDGQAKLVADHQPAAFAAMEGLFETTKG